MEPRTVKATAAVDGTADAGRVHNEDGFLGVGPNPSSNEPSVGIRSVSAAVADQQITCTAVADANGEIGPDSDRPTGSVRDVILLTVNQVAERLACTKRQVQYLIEAGEIPSLRIGLGKKRQGGLRIPSHAVDAFIAERLRN
jgi:excisionase family DNA binding protein